MLQYRTVDGRIVRKETAGAVKHRVRSRKWYGEHLDKSGRRVRVPLSEDKAEAFQQLDQLRDQAGQPEVDASEVLARAATEFLELLGERPALFAAAAERGYVEWGKVPDAERRETHVLEDALVLQAIVMCGALVVARWDRVWLDARTTGLPARTVGAIVRIVAKRRYKVQQFGVERRGQTAAVVLPCHVGDLEPLTAEITRELRSRRVLEALGKQRSQKK